MAGPERELTMIGYPDQLYTYLREFAKQDGSTNRAAITDAVERHLKDIELLCAKAGFAPYEGKRKLVRTPLDPSVKEQVKEVGDRLGIDSTTILMLCLRREMGLLITSPERETILARMKRRLARAKR